MSDIPDLDTILKSERHWAISGEENPLFLPRVIDLCRGYRGNGEFRDFHNHICGVADEEISAQITKKIHERIWEFLSLDDILKSRYHWVFPNQEENPLFLPRVIALCREYKGNGKLRDFRKHACNVTGEQLDTRITKEIHERREEFKNGKVEELQ